MTRLQGADISIWNGPLNATKAKAAGMKWLSVKATQGDDFIDRYWVQHIRACRDAGLLCMPYVFVWPWRQAQSTWDLFRTAIDQVGGWEGLLVPALDVEGDAHCSVQGDPNYVAHASKLLDFIEAELGKHGVVYTFPSFAAEHNVGGQLGHKSLLWEASYTKNPRCFAGWDEITFWQYADDGSWPGMGDGLDMDFFLGSDADLARLSALGKTLPATAHDLMVVGTDGKEVACKPEWHDANTITAEWGPILNACGLTIVDAAMASPGIFHAVSGRCFLGQARPWLEAHGWGLAYHKHPDGRERVYIKRPGGAK
jgi:lysozyme